MNGNPPSDEQSVEIIIKKFDILSINVEGRSEGCEDYAPLNVFFREAEIPVQHDLDEQEYTFVGEHWVDKNGNLIIEAGEFEEVFEFSKTTDKDEFTMEIPEDMPIGLYRLKIQGTDHVSNYFWVIFNAPDSGLSEGDLQNYWKDEVTGNRVGIWKNEVKTSHHSVELMICMASAANGGGCYPTTEYMTADILCKWVMNRIEFKEGTNPPSDIIEYVNQIKAGEEKPDGDCDCLSPFLVSLTRAAGMPAREINGFGLAYIYPLKFGWSHNWVEAFYEGSWQVWDPTAIEIFRTDYTGFIEHHKKNRGLIHLLEVWDEIGVWRGDYWSHTEPSLMATLSCPANLHAYDSEGRHVGLNESGGIDLEIPDSYYSGPDSDPERIVIFNQSENVICGVEALDEGEFNLTLTQSTATKTTMVTYTDIPITETTEVTVDVSEENPTYTMEIDDDGDGTPEHTTSPDSIKVITTCPYDHDGDGIVEDDIDDLIMATDAYLGFNTGREYDHDGDGITEDDIDDLVMATDAYLGFITCE